MAVAAGLFACWAGAAEAIREAPAHIQPILKEYCYDCHADGVNKGQVAFDEFKSEEAMLGDHDLWLKALKNVRAGIMPPPKKRPLATATSAVRNSVTLPSSKLTRTSCSP